MENRMAILGIFIHDIEQSEQVNALLHTYGQYIIGRLGIPHRDREVSVICVVLDAPNDIISALAGKLGRLPVCRLKHNTGNKLADFLFLRRVIYT